MVLDEVALGLPMQSLFYRYQWRRSNEITGVV